MENKLPKGTYLVDMDGVLANYVGEFNRRWKAKFPQREFIPEEELKYHHIEENYDDRYEDDVNAIPQERDFFASLDPIPGALEGIEKLAQEGNEVFICTAPNTINPYCEQGKKEWVRKHLGMYWVRRMIITKDKTLVQGDYLIDDKPEIKGLIKPTWERIVYDQPYNRIQELKNHKRMTWYKGLFEKN